MKSQCGLNSCCWFFQWGIIQSTFDPVLFTHGFRTKIPIWVWHENRFFNSCFLNSQCVPPQLLIVIRHVCISLSEYFSYPSCRTRNKIKSDLKDTQTVDFQCGHDEQNLSFNPIHSGILYRAWVRRVAPGCDRFLQFGYSTFGSTEGKSFQTVPESRQTKCAAKRSDIVLVGLETFKRWQGHRIAKGQVTNGAKRYWIELWQFWELKKLVGLKNLAMILQILFVRSSTRAATHPYSWSSYWQENNSSNPLCSHGGKFLRVLKLR